MFHRIFNPSAAVYDVATNSLWDSARLRAESQQAHALAGGDRLRGGRPRGNHPRQQRLIFCRSARRLEQGGAAVPVDPKVGEVELANIVSQSGARAVIRRELPGKGILDDFKAGGLAAYDTLEMQRLPGGSAPEGPLVQLDDIALILYTSGTTGKAKGVVHTFRTLLARLRSLEAYVPRHVVKRTACLLPTNFGHGLICNCLYPLYSGAILYIFPRNDLTILAGLGGGIDSYGITYMSSVPMMWKILLRGAEAPRKGSLRLIHCGSAPLSASLWQGIKDWSGIQSVRNVYGITEVGSWTAGALDASVPPTDGFIGPGWGAKIAVMPEEAGESGPQGFEPHTSDEVGEVWLRTPALMQSYYERPDLYAAVVEEAWFRTGDLGFLDERGNLTLVGRKSHEINCGGMKVFPEDVDLLLDRHPEIAQACTFGIEDPVAGQTIAAAVSPETPGAEIDLPGIGLTPVSWRVKHLGFQGVRCCLLS